ncbi:NusA-like transcription termination signal-binding factor [Desulfurococcus mucosus]|uniref:Probable transcription termination protein NusA n=1 Tax=Desulfurococcus mucosus (strain ATCC 35584 / DSM 2162 / JCM 9187 / O7/1) TaxID=765177 RepID=E8R7R2_DESM0|nr:NusA-like transcription termination signal-binding factor [Desulfurococcus mucosus]ADV65656.1 NusA family KH domain protein [Desulfurococcus mucosus DSM 2162]
MSSDKSQVKITPDEFRFMALLNELTGAVVRDCIVEEENNRVIFLVNPEDVGRAIGPKGFFVQRLKKILNKNIEIVGYSSNLEEQVKYALAPARIKEIKLSTKPDGSKVLYVAVDPADKGIAIGKNGRNVQRARLILKRHFDIDSVVIA